jgi:hypothetical protein
VLDRPRKLKDGTVGIKAWVIDRCTGIPAWEGWIGAEVCKKEARSLRPHARIRGSCLHGWWIGPGYDPDTPTLVLLRIDEGGAHPNHSVGPTGAASLERPKVRAQMRSETASAAATCQAPSRVACWIVEQADSNNAYTSTLSPRSTRFEMEVSGKMRTLVPSSLSAGSRP